MCPYLHDVGSQALARGICLVLAKRAVTVGHHQEIGESVHVCLLFFPMVVWLTVHDYRRNIRIKRGRLGGVTWH